MITLYTWLCQVIDKDKSCKNAVSRITSYLAASLFFLVLCWLASTAVGENPSSFFETKKLEQKNFVDTKKLEQKNFVDLHKLDPVLKRFVLDQEVMAAPDVLPFFAPPMMQPRDPGTISAIIRTSGNPIAIESSGARVRTVIGDFATADVPIQSLNRLIHLPNVIYVQASRLMEPTLLDVSVPGTGARQVWNSSPGYTGKGVIVGVIDSGIDWSHPDFMGNDGTSRILYIWDQWGDTGERGRRDAGVGYGVEWTKADIDSGLCEEMDPSGHGTHVTSTIAGNDGDMHGFTGMAPDADIIVVKTNFGDAEILDGVDYILRKASELNRPVVVNMSFGSQWGPHDGTSLLDQAIDILLGGPGKAIVAAAGNEGGRPIHVGAALRQPVGENYPWSALQTFVGTESTEVQIWYDSPDPLSVRLLLPKNDRGDLADLGMGWVSEGQLQVFSVPGGPIAGAEIAIGIQQFAIYPNFKGAYIHISNNGDLTIPIDEYIYAVEYDGPGIAIDTYVVWRGYFEWASRLPASVLFPDRSFLLEGDGYNTIISPGSASEVICVGSYASKSEWVDWENRIRDENLTIGSISAFSSLGPLLNGARKPDIAAPGEMVVAAFSTDAWEMPNRIYRDGEHVSMRGTSMATPHVTGAIALMYEQNPNLTASEVKYILTRSAADRGPAGWDKAWGYGALNVLAAMNIPSEPRVLRATAGDGSMAIEWLPNEESDIAGYRIYASLNTGYWMLDTGYWLSDAGDWTPDAGCWRLDAGSWTLDTGCWMLVSSIEHRASSIKYQVSGIQNGMPVSMSVSAYNSAGSEGPKSQEITIIPTTPGPDVTPPDPPGGLTAVPIDSAVDLTWSQNREYDLSGYRIYYGTSTGNYSQVQRVGKVNNYRLKGLTNGVRVYISVSAVDTSGNESKRTPEVSAVPQLFTRASLRYQGGWPVLMKHDVYSSPTLYDVDGDGRLEVSVSSKDGRIYLLRHDGSSMRGWPISTGMGSVSSPALADVDGDGSVEVVVGAGDRVYMWSGSGTPIYGWPVSTLGNVTASPALGDIDNDGRMEVIVGSRDGILYAYNNDGSTVKGWPVITRGYIHSSAALVDVDGDSGIEVVVGSGSGYLYVFKGDGTTIDGWPVYVRSEILSSPAVGDIDGDGSMEIVVADKSGWLHAWHYSGKPVEGWPVDLQDDIVSSPALGDLDDGKNTLEIVIGTEGGSVYVLRSDGTTMDGWPVSVADDMTSSPAIGDIDGDGRADVVVATGTGLGYTGLVYAFRNSGRKIGTLWPVHTEGNISYSSPALGDLDGDGDVEVVVGSCRDAAGTGGYLHAWDISGRPGDDGIVWGGFRHDSRHTGVADDMIPPSFVIAVLQNPALKKHLNVYAISSEKLIAYPELTVEVTYSGSDEKMVQAVTFANQFDVSSNIYYLSLTLAEQYGMYNFTVSGTDASGNTGSSSKSVSISPIPSSPHPSIPPPFSLLPNYPNPFNPGTWIPYELAQTSDVTVEIYSSTGQLIRSLALGRRTAGSYTAAEDAAYWDGTDDSAQEVASGAYFCVLRAGSFEACRKMILLR